MSTFFRGPSLFTHVVVVATAEALGVPLLRSQGLETRTALILGVIFAALYTIIAFGYACSGKNKK